MDKDETLHKEGDNVDEFFEIIDNDEISEATARGLTVYDKALGNLDNNCLHTFKSCPGLVFIGGIPFFYTKTPKTIVLINIQLLVIYLAR